MSNPRDLQASLAQFESACHGLLNASQRRAAEQALLDFRRSPQALVLAQYALHESQDATVLLQAAICLRQVVVERWHTFPAGARLDAKEKLFTLVVDRFHRNKLSKPVVLQTVRVLAIMWKRSWLDAAAPPRAKEHLFNRCSELLHQGQPPALRALALYYLTALVEEFSAVKSSQIGVALEYHLKCKHSFQAAGLLHAFQLANAVLAGAAAAREVVLSAAQLVAACFRWDFSSAASAVFREDGAALAPAAVCPDKSWAPHLLSPPFPQTLAHVLFATRSDLSLAQPLRQLLIQAATLKGEVFSEQAQRMQYLAALLDAADRLLAAPLAPPAQCVQLPQTFESVDAAGEALQAAAAELLDICALVAAAVRTFGAESFVSDARARAFLESLFTLARLLLDGAAKTSAVHGARAAEESWMMEGFDHLLEALSLLSDALVVSPLRGEDQPVLEAFGELFSLYLGCRLAIAQAVGVVSNADDAASDVDYEQFEDPTKLASHLALVAAVARTNCGSAVDALGSCATNLLQVTSRRDDWNEQVYWLTLISAHVWADEGDGEVPEVPPGVRLYMSSQQPEKMVGLLFHLFELLEREAAAVQQDPFNADVSPLVAEKLLWAVARWSKTYLFAKTAFAPAVSEKVLVSGVSTCNVYLSKWGSQPNVVASALDLLLTFVRNTQARELLRSLPAWQQVFDALEQSLRSTTWEPLNNLAADDHAQLLRVVALSLEPKRASNHENVLREGFQRLTEPVVARAQVLQASVSRGKKWSLDVLRVVALVEGVGGAKSTGVLGGWVREVVVTALNGPLVRIVASIIPTAYGASAGADSEGRLIIASALRLFATALDTHLLTTPEGQAVQLFECAGQLLKSLAECNNLQQKRQAFVGKRKRVDDEEEEAWAQDVLCMLKILSSLTERDLLDFSDGPSQQSPVIDAAGVVLQGVQLVLPLLSEEVFKYPGVGEQYFALLTSLVQMYPEKLAALDKALFSSVLKSLEFGIKDYRVSVVRSSFEALASLAQFHATEQRKNPPGQGLARQLEGQDRRILLDLLQFVLSFVIFQTFDVSILDPAANAVLALIACEEQQFKPMVERMLESQTDQAMREQLEKAFTRLICDNNVRMSFDRKNRSNFKKNVHSFVTNVRGFMRSK